MILGSLIGSHTITGIGVPLSVVAFIGFDVLWKRLVKSDKIKSIEHL